MTWLRRMGTRTAGALLATGLTALGGCSSSEDGGDGRGGTAATGGSLSGGGGADDFGNSLGGGGALGGGSGGGGGVDLGGGSGGDSDPIDDGCASVDVRPMATFEPGNLLVIFDRSSSMNTPFGGAGSRFQAASNALTSAIQPFTCDGTVRPDGSVCVDVLTVGAIMFPGAGGVCGTTQPIDSPEQLNWRKSTEFITAWNDYWSRNPIAAVAMTPISEGFMQGAAAITAAQSQLEGNFAVVFLTDGEDLFCGGGVEAQPQAQAWAAEGIPTYVVNLDTGGPGGAFNDAVATAGGTGMSIDPANQAELEAVLRKVLNETAKVSSCDLTLQGEISDAEGACEMGTVNLGTRRIDCSDTDGYQIVDSTTIQLTGPACDELMGGAILSASFPCNVLLQ